MRNQRSKPGYCLSIALMITGLVITSVTISITAVRADLSTTTTTNQSNIVLHLPMDEGADNTVFDTSGNGNDGTITGAEWVDGKYGKALSFSGSQQDYVQIPHDTSFNFGTTTDFTIVAWIKTTSSSGRIFSKGSWTNSINGYMMRMGAAGVLRFEVITSGHLNVYGPGSFNIDSDPINNGEWHHVAGIADRDTGGKLYVDGVLSAETLEDTSVGSVSTTRAPTIGAYDLLNTEFFTGAIDEVAIFNHALTEDEVLANFLNNSLPAAPITTVTPSETSTFGTLPNQGDLRPLFALLFVTVTVAAVVLVLGYMRYTGNEKLLYRVQQQGFSSVQDWEAARRVHAQNPEELAAITSGRFNNRQEWLSAKKGKFTTRSQWIEAQKTQARNSEELAAITSGNFGTRDLWLKAKQVGATTLADYINYEKFEKVRAVLLKLKPNIQVQLNRIAELSELPKNEVEDILKSLAKEKGIGEYLEMEQVFIRASPEDALLEEAFKEWSVKEREKRGKD